MDDLLCKETFNFDMFKTSSKYSMYYNDKYYGDIIVKYIKKKLFLKDNDINAILTKICNEIDNDISTLKYNILQLELLLFNTNYYSFEVVRKAWVESRLYLLKKYSYINKHDYKNLFKFFLLMLHNVPYFLPYDDNVIPGCNCIFDLDKKRQLNKEPYKKYYEYRLTTNDCYNYMRISNWLNISNSKNFNCYCENYF